MAHFKAEMMSQLTGDLVEVCDSFFEPVRAATNKVQQCIIADGEHFEGKKKWVIVSKNVFYWNMELHGFSSKNRNI